MLVFFRMFDNKVCRYGGRIVKCVRLDCPAWRVPKIAYSTLSWNATVRKLGRENGTHLRLPTIESGVTGPLQVAKLWEVAA
jgi:hypothetical protein